MIAVSNTEQAESATETEREVQARAIEHEISTLYRSTKSLIKDLAERFQADMQPAAFTILRYVMDRQPIRAGDIATALGMDKSAVSRQITVLRESGLLETRPDPEDGRATLLVGSERATTELARFRAGFRADYMRILDSWPADDVENFARLLARFNQSQF